MSTSAKLLGFLAILLAAFALAFGIGKLFAPLNTVDQPQHALNSFAANSFALNFIQPN
ncbi:hypothetical protein [Psychromicrobium lacuslunae]|uniref:hypothetical protein n=1 Tax=Psychromicrobium lacuslunae TaxID=1618207 RepID=UPI000A8388A4|nr:hypothetical protein [Psychromicrobium lacuslunae]